MRIQVFTHDSKFYAEQVDEDNVLAGVSHDTTVIRLIVGMNTAESIESLTRAVNNRTRERNYFRLYSEMLDGTISDEEFDRQIEDHEDLYVVTDE